MKTTTLPARAFIVALLVLMGLISYELSGPVQKAEAIPAFARKYDFKCNVCHVPGVPKLNDFWNLFRDRGYQLGSDADSPVYEGIGMGFWPVSIRATVGYQAAQVRTEGSGVTPADLDSPASISSASALCIVILRSASCIRRDSAARDSGPAPRTETLKARSSA